VRSGRSRGPRGAQRLLEYSASSVGERMAAAGLEGLEAAEETETFVQEDVLAVIKESVDSVLANATYSHVKVKQWTNNCIETCMKRLKDLNKPFKYMVTAVLMQKNGAGLHTATSCFWDNTTDGSATLRWENKSMYCIVTVFGLSI